MGDEISDGRSLLREAMRGALDRVTSRGGSWNRVVVQGDRGFMVVRGARDDEDVEIIAAAGRALERRLSEQEAQHLYDLGYRRYNAARPYVREASIDCGDVRETITDELIELTLELYASSADTVAVHERYDDLVDVENPRLIEAMRRLSKARDMSSRQKLYWAVVRADVLLALDAPPPKSLKSDSGHMQWVETGLKEIEHISSSVNILDFKEVTSYNSAAIFSDLKSLEQVDPRGLHFIRLPGRLAIMLALAQGWSSLLINPRSDVGGELYRNELESILDGLKQLGW